MESRCTLDVRVALTNIQGGQVDARSRYRCEQIALHLGALFGRFETRSEGISLGGAGVALTLWLGQWKINWRNNYKGGSLICRGLVEW